MMKVILWIVQVLLGVSFLLAGIMKTAMPVEQLVENMAWAENMSVGMIRFIGISEFLGGIGVILPSLLKIKPILTPIAAIMLGVVMVLAAITHASRGESAEIVTNVVILAMALFVAWGRWKKYPIAARS